MKTPAELYKESLLDWPEPLPGSCLSPKDWREFVGLFVANPFEHSTDVGLQLASCIEQQGLTVDHFKGGAEFLYVFAFNSLSESAATGDGGAIQRLVKYHKIHGQAVVDVIASDDTIMDRTIALTKNLNQGDK